MTVTEPFFSVIIPTYNRADKLRRALASLVEQSCRDFEVLVCDDGSTDDTAVVVAEFSGTLPVSHLWEPNWGGPARPRNRGIQAAVGQWVCFLDADDWWYPHKLAQIRPLTGTNDIIYHACDVYTPRGKRPGTKKSRQLTVPAFVDLMKGGNGLITSAVAVRRTLLAKSGGFAEEKRFVAIEDYDLWLRLASLTDRFCFIPVALGVYWVDGDSISGFSQRFIEQEQALADRYMPQLPAIERREAECVLAYKIGIARKSLGQFSESRRQLAVAMRSRQPRIRLYAAAYYLLALLHSRYTLP